MQIDVWTKYLPVIRIVLKRSLSAEQKIGMNASDFLRAGFARKTGYKFLIKLKEGRLSHVLVDEPLASALASLLTADEALKPLLSTNEFYLSLSAKFELTIRHIRQTAQPAEETAVSEVA